MSTTAVEEQAANLFPPRKSQIIALAVDSTARAYDLWTLTFDGKTPGSGGRQEVFVQFTAEGTDVFFCFDSGNTADLSDATTISAGGALAYAVAYGAKLVKDGLYPPVRLDVTKDRYLHVKAASGTSGTLRFWTCSPGQ